MQNKRLIMGIIGLAVIGLPMLLYGCISSGVSQEDYDNLSNELASARNELDTLRAQQAQTQPNMTKVNAYADILDMCIEPWLVLVGEKSKRGYTAADTVKWVADLDKKIKIMNDAALTTLWVSYVNTANVQEKTRKGVQLMSYVSDQVIAGTK